MESEAAEERGNNEAASDKRGKYRIMAETKFLEEELEELERIQDASAICEELLFDVEARPDALVPTTHGPVNPAWNRWFEGRLQMSDNVIKPLQLSILPYGFKEPNLFAAYVLLGKIAKFL